LGALINSKAPQRIGQAIKGRSHVNSSNDALGTVWDGRSQSQLLMAVILLNSIPTRRGRSSL